MTSKDIVALVGLCGLLVYQATQLDFSALAQTVVLVLGYLGLAKKTDDTKQAVAQQEARLNLVEDNTADLLSSHAKLLAHSTCDGHFPLKNAVENRRTK